jgi:hypothetical protein
MDDDTRARRIVCPLPIFFFFFHPLKEDEEEEDAGHMCVCCYTKT